MCVCISYLYEFFADGLILGGKERLHVLVMGADVACSTDIKWIA